MVFAGGRQRFSGIVSALRGIEKSTSARPSSPWTSPPLSVGKRQRALGLDAQQFVVHGQLADATVGLIQTELERVGIRAARQAGMEAGKAVLTPDFEPRDGQSQFAAERIERLTAQQADDDLRLARGMPSAGRMSRRSGPASGGGIRAARLVPSEATDFPLVTNRRGRCARASAAAPRVREGIQPRSSQPCVHGARTIRVPVRRAAHAFPR